MCLIAFGIDAHPQWPLWIASNRDEAWDRQALPLHDWTLPSGKRVYAGRDQLAGGTWLGFSEDGRVAMLTNVRNGRPQAGPSSRGELVTGWLDHDADWDGWLERFDTGQYGGFNLVLGDTRRGRWAWFTNQASASGDLPCPPGWRGRALAPGVYGLSNGALDTPWPKTVALREALARHLEAGAPALAEPELVNALLRMDYAPEAALPRTGVAPELERELSSIFVHAPRMGYGTRCSLLARCDANGHLDLQEWTHEPRRLPPEAPRPARWPLAWSVQRRISISMWGMPTSS
jgi:uncharacterized protein with NRDE domain